MQYDVKWILEWSTRKKRMIGEDGDEAQKSAKTNKPKSRLKRVSWQFSLARRLEIGTPE